ncbi:site-specific integrase [Variovorax sp. OV329]|uniref:site-specific integrase n=1 Tax=Variovorax sp. OV329 TaxID=1882825 RepID=UPI0008F2200A|nr:site-specific integrase [Variovorax sp. OV329]SFM91967.1 Site-specific recombinase XerD [Variovorax sp. OV329]
MSRAKTPPRKLHRGHFAFMRALAQGLDERASWDRYLRMEGEGADLRTIRRTIAWIRDEFAAAARRENRPGTAKLILMDPQRFSAVPAAKAPPSLAEFAAAHGMEDFSEAEQIQAYDAAYPGAGQAPTRGASGRGQGGRAQLSRRARLIDHQLEALRWLQDLVVRDPRPGDGVSAWIHPTLARRLERAGLPTLDGLVRHINGIGARWWVQVPGVGALKAARIVDWLRANEDVLGLRLGAHVARPRTLLAPATLAAVVPAATALVPYEKFILPAELDGRAGRFRGPPERCLLIAGNDHEAIGAWLASKRPAPDGKDLSATQRSYRKEAERLLLWSVLERKKALSSLTVEDALAFRHFLADPPASWCGPRHTQRWSPLWRPLEGPLSPAALRQSMGILRGLFGFLVSQGYLVGNPLAAVAPAPLPQRPLGSARTLSFAQWDHIESLLKAHGDTEHRRRLRRGMRWLYATGLRLAEITQAKCEDLEQTEVRGDRRSAEAGWLLHVVGKSGRTRQVPVPTELVDEFGDELARHGFARHVQAESNREIEILARFTPPRPVAWSASGLYQAMKTFLAKAAEGLEGRDADRFRKASVHWIRHTHGSHALQGREGHSPVPLQVMQNNLGHVSIGTTSQYFITECDERIQAGGSFWGNE